MTATTVETQHQVWCRALQVRWHEEIPISASMGIAVDAFDGDRLAVRANLAPNLNVHGSVFAGSLFSLAALCAWGLIHLQMCKHGLNGSIIFADGRLCCLAPARDDIIATAVWNAAAEAALGELVSAERCRISLPAQVESGGRIVSEFGGEYAVRLQHGG